MSHLASKSVKVYNFLKKERVIMNLKNDLKEKILEELIEYIPVGKISNLTRAKIFDEVMKRESLESTGIGNGIAIPHAKFNTLGGFYIVVGISKKGVDFAAIDGKPVHIIFLVVSDTKEKILYIRILARIARLLHNKSFNEKLLKQTTENDVINFIKKYETF
ncbi:MAG: hypothetical protein B5M53_01315 [Candidatus Cloacimonas sp. 4484_209]|nr:MAG: hypothetical protein B5M53_01315 [Candidatus Cloacimonas sp. 4484_209]